MTDGPAPTRAARPKGPRPPAGLAVPLVALAAFFGTFTVLALRMGAGDDPALGEPQTAGAPAPVEPRRILIRRIIKTKVILLPPRPTPQAAQPPPAPPTGGGAAPRALAAQAPPAAAAPAPVPAPAAPVTRAS